MLILRPGRSSHQTAGTAPSPGRPSAWPPPPADWRVGQLPLRPEAFGLTARERDVATLVAWVLVTAAIAEKLVMSPWAVQDHLKAAFDKTGTHSRRELLASVFFHDQLPGVVAQDPLNAGGHLQSPGTR